jgi:hypothetical protein
MNPWETVAKPHTLDDEARNLREWIGAWFARRIIAEYQKELRAWMMRADAGWTAAVESRAEVRKLKRPA